MKTIDKIITKVDTSRGAPMGRSNVKPQNFTVVDIGAKHKVLSDGFKHILIFDSAVPMIDGAYDKGGAYWGIGSQLRVQYTKDLSFIEFYRR
jgi:hypothetical protein